MNQQEPEIIDRQAALLNLIKEQFNDKITDSKIEYDQLTIEVPALNIKEICQTLRDHSSFHFETLLDICGVDYLFYGVSQWQTEVTTSTGFSRATDISRQDRLLSWTKPRFAVVYHLLSLQHNFRLRLRSFPEGEPPTIDSLVSIWPSANWYEREAFDLFGIIFNGHPDLRRLLTDYGFIGHPFRKDFPLIGNVEMRYDASLQRCVYDPVSIQPRTLVPKVIRSDNRYKRD